MPAVHLIWAQARNRVIGKDNAIPWRLPEDMAHLKQQTMGAPVLMGRKTWDSLPLRFRPLPGRRNLVLTRSSTWADTGAERVASIEEAVQMCCQDPVLWVLGGAEIYALAMAQASKAVVTEIDADFEGTAFAPVLGPQWKLQSREAHTSTTGLPYSFAIYQK